MLNRTSVDVEDASIRGIYFQGRSAEEITSTMPILPVDAPGLSFPGPSLVRNANIMGDNKDEETPPDPVAPVKGKRAKKVKKGRPNGAYLTMLVRSLLYQAEGFILKLECGDTTEEVSCIPGVAYTGQESAFFGNTQIEQGGNIGPEKVKLMIMGKCLGHAEAKSKRPFVGPGTDPLRASWQEAGLPLPSKALPTFITNVLRFVPPAAVGKKIPKEWVADGLYLFYQELAVCRPEYLLLLGADALKAVFGASATLSKFKGRVADLEVDLRATQDDEEDKFVCKVIACEHPAAVMYDPDRGPSMTSSLRLLARTMGFAPAVTQHIPTDYRAITTVHELREAVAESVLASQQGGYIAFDCEWEGRRPSEEGAYLYTVQWSHKPGHARVAYLRSTGGGQSESMPIEEVTPLLNELLAGSPARLTRLVGHYAKADLPWLASIGVDLYPHYVGPEDDEANTAEERSYYEGAFDIYVAAHAHEESCDRGLEILGVTHLEVERWDLPVEKWKTDYCTVNKLKKSQLRGYGNCPPEIMTKYAGYDADVPGRLYLLYNGDPMAGTKGLLDKDRFGLSCRKIFASRMRAWAAIAEMEYHGLLVDRDQHRKLRDVVFKRREELLEEFRAEINWPDFAPSKRTHRIEFLFGEDYAYKDGLARRPSGALSLGGEDGLQPYKATEAYGGVLWEKALERYKRNGGIPPTPAADKETLTVYGRSAKQVAMLLDIDFLNTAMKIMFRQPDEVTEGPDDEEESDGFVEGPVESHSRGFVANIASDNRVRTRLSIVETGRLSSSAPNLQNCGESVDTQYDRILKRDEQFKTRSIIHSEVGWWLVFADLRGAEIAAAGWSSGDKTLIDHVRRANLPEDHPDYLDLHADLAKRSFNLEGSLKDIKKKHKSLRTAAKRTRFGYYYGSGAESILRQAQLESPDVTLEQIVAIIEGHDATYPQLKKYFGDSSDRPGYPGWMRNGYGGMRRFRKSTDNEIRAAQGREAQNWTCQGLVADNISTSLGNTWYERNRRRMRSRIVLSVHDSIGLEVPTDELAEVVDDLLPLCMCERSPVVITDLGGEVVSGRGPYKFGIEVSVYRSWGVEVPESEWRPLADSAKK